MLFDSNLVYIFPLEYTINTINKRYFSFGYIYII